MGESVGPTAISRITFIQNLNNAFSPGNISRTEKKYDEWMQGRTLESVIYRGEFMKFAQHIGATKAYVSTEDGVEEIDNMEELVSGLRQFEPGTFDIVSLVVFSNLSGKYLNIEDDHPMKPLINDFYPRPMVFERTFGAREEVVIRSTQYGIKITLQTLTQEDRDTRQARRNANRTEEGFS